MALDTKVVQALERALTRWADQEAKGPRLIDDARRLWGRTLHLLTLGLISTEIDALATELACYALQLPLIQPVKPTGGKAPRTTLRDRCERAAEFSVALLDKLVPTPTLERISQILLEIPQRAPDLDEARVLADAVNLEDFGVSGLLVQAIVLSRQGNGLLQVAEGCQKRDLYGYWEARLKDSFHFEPVRQIAAARVESARKIAAMLQAELDEDLPPGE